MTDRRLVVVTTAWLRPGDEVDRLLVANGHEVVHASSTEREISGVSLAEAIADADAVIAGTEAFTADIIAAAPGLMVIARTGVGYDNIDLEAAAAHGIPVCATPQVNSQSVAEYAIGLMLSLARAIPGNVQKVREGLWDQSSEHELAGKVLGIVGMGAIGKLVAQMARGIGMRVIARDVYEDREFADLHSIEYTDLSTLLHTADVVSLHVALDDSTRHLVDERRLAWMKPSAFLINTSRGGILDEDALASAIRRGALAGAALDVVEQEPLPLSSPLRGLDRVIVTPHVAAGTVESRLRSGMMAAESVVDALAHRFPKNVVNRVETARAPRAQEQERSHG